jgi:hypothetical protein
LREAGEETGQMEDEKENSSISRSSEDEEEEEEEEEGSIQLGKIISPLYVSNCLPNFLQTLLLLPLLIIYSLIFSSIFSLQTFFPNAFVVVFDDNVTV